MLVGVENADESKGERVENAYLHFVLARRALFIYWTNFSEGLDWGIQLYVIIR